MAAGQGGRRLECPKCRGVIVALRADSRFFVCPHCRHAAETRAGALRVVAGPLPAPRGAALALHAPVVADSRRYQVSAIVQYRDRDGELSYDYDLTRGAGGSVSLEEADGAWTLYRYLPHGTRQVRLSDGAARLFNESFRAQQEFDLEIAALAGEFEELPRPGTRARFAWYESEERGLMAELDERGAPLAWYLGYEHDAPAPARGLRAALTARSAEPPGAALARLSALFAAGALAIHLLFAGIEGNQPVYDSGERTVATDGLWVSEPFTLAGRTSNVLAEVRTSVDNQWLELRLRLVDPRTGKWYQRHEDVAYYHGYEGGEAWREGGRDERIWFSGIPPGEYVLEVGAHAERADVRYRLSLTRDVTNRDYLWFMLGLFAVVPGLYFLRRMDR